MATPVGHALAGYAIYRARPRAATEASNTPLFIGLLLAVAPDFDFIPGLLINQPSRYHQGVSHSLGVALVVSIATTLCYALLTGQRQRKWHWLPFFFCAYASHLLLDLFGPDSRPPYGIPLLWPLSDATYLAPVTLLPGVGHGGLLPVRTRDWLGVVLRWRNVFAVGVEILLIVPVIGVIELLRGGALSLLTAGLKRPTSIKQRG